MRSFDNSFPHKACMVLSRKNKVFSKKACISPAYLLLCHSMLCDNKRTITSEEVQAKWPNVNSAIRALFLASRSLTPTAVPIAPGSLM